MIKKFKIKDGIEIKIKKGVPAGFGMGSSAASAAATVVAFDKMYGLKLDENTLVEFAGYGEKASAGSIHYDNVAASVLGGFVIVRTNPLNVIKIEPPMNLRMCIAVPKLVVPKKKTKVSRGVLPKKVSLIDSVANLSNAAAIVAGFMKKDPKLIGDSIKDVIVETARQHMIPGFAKVKENALKAGALGVTISGAGPSVIAFSESSVDLKKISLAMSKGFASANIKCQTVICKPSKGAVVIKK
jgi:homoserine kinase